MYLQALTKYMLSKHLRRADVARIAGVTRAAVTRWFATAGNTCNVETHTLLRLAHGLGIDPAALLREEPDLSPMATRFLWDRLYPNMETFVEALARRRLPAIARLVQVVGFHDAMPVVGRRAVALFPHYKRWIKPARRRQLEMLWPFYASQK
jgi:transcriptional regulator with XRE-family HTH domain